MSCPKCGHPGTITELMPEGHPHHAKLLCAGPGRHYLKWLPKPVTANGRPIWIMGPDNCPELLAKAKKMPEEGWFCREGPGSVWRPIAELKAELAKDGGKAK
jgi:hypothetical protein